MHKASSKSQRGITNSGLSRHSLWLGTRKEFKKEKKQPILTPSVTNDTRQYEMIETFGSKETRLVWEGNLSKKLPQDIQQVARRKLRMLDAAHQLQDLRVPPGNRLEALGGDLKGYFSIRINRQWRIIFRWQNNNCYQVEIIDYH